MRSSGTHRQVASSAATPSNVEPDVGEAYCGKSGRTTIRRQPLARSSRSAAPIDGLP